MKPSVALMHDTLPDVQVLHERDVDAPSALPGKHWGPEQPSRDGGTLRTGVVNLLPVLGFSRFVNLLHSRSAVAALSGFSRGLRRSSHSFWREAVCFVPLQPRSVQSPVLRIPCPLAWGHRDLCFGSSCGEICHHGLVIARGYSYCQNVWLRG